MASKTRAVESSPIVVFSLISASLVNGEPLIAAALAALSPAVTAICSPSSGSTVTVPLVRTACVAPSAVTVPPEMVIPLLLL